MKKSNLPQKTCVTCGRPFIWRKKWGAAIIEAAQKASTAYVVTSFAPVGPVATKLATLQASLAAEGITLHQQRRSYDSHTWPYATKGFFKVKKMIPTILTKLGHSHVEDL